MPNVYADSTSGCADVLNNRDWHAIVSLPPSINDRDASGVAAAELGYLAGADRIEGTLFGNRRAAPEMCACGNPWS
jgi:2-isopropylmalate synthase